MIRLFTDTSANLPLRVLREHHISVLSFSYTVDGEPVHYDENSSADFDGKAFYGAMRDGAVVKTSMINVVKFELPFSEALQAGDDVLYVGMSGGISGAAGAAAIAVKDLRQKYPDRRIAAVDTYAASLGEGLQVLAAARMIKDGVPFDEIEKTLLRERDFMCQYFTVDDLVYLRRGGRISGAAAMVGSMLNIKPILTGDPTGHIVSCGKSRGMKRALTALADRYAQLARDKTEMIGIAHADNEEGHQLLMNLLRERGFAGECLLVDYEPVTGSHVGPGTVALFFMGTRK